jgi:hypothetical protein
MSSKITIAIQEKMPSADRLYCAYIDEPFDVAQKLYSDGIFSPAFARLFAEHERIVAERLAAVVAERDTALAEIAKLAIPQAVYLNLLTGRIAKPNHEQINHIYPDLMSETMAEMTAERDAAIAERDQLTAKIAKLNWYWNAEDREYSYNEPCEIFEYIDYGQVVEIDRGGVVETRFMAILPPSKDATSDDDFLVNCQTREEAEAAVAAELARRAALNPDHVT